MSSWRTNNHSPYHFHLKTQLLFHNNHNKISSSVHNNSNMNPANDINMQHTETSLEHRADDSNHHNSDQQNEPAWTSPPLSRPPPHVLAGKVIRTIFHWETGVWQHEHEGPIFDWGFLPPRPLRSSCSLPPPPIPRPSTDPTAGKALRLSFYWEFSDWEHEWENRTRLLAPLGPLTGVSFSVLPPTPLVPPPAIPKAPPPHAVHGKILFAIWFLHGNLCFHEYEDGTRVGKPMDYRYP